MVSRPEHVRLWRMVEGAVVDALRQHPDFITEKGRQSLVASVTKRVVGNLLGHAQQTLRGGRLGGCSSGGAILVGALGDQVLQRPGQAGSGSDRGACAKRAATGGEVGL